MEAEDGSDVMAVAGMALLLSLGRAAPLAYMSDLASKWAATEKQEYTEVQFATKGDFRIGFYQRKKDQRAFASSGSIGVVRTFISVADLAKTKDLVDKAMELLKTK